MKALTGILTRVVAAKPTGKNFALYAEFFKHTMQDIRALPEVDTEELLTRGYHPERTMMIPVLDPLVPYGGIGIEHMYCQSCGERVDKDDHYCRGCGRTFMEEHYETYDIGGRVEEEHTLGSEAGDLGATVQEA